MNSPSPPSDAADASAPAIGPVTVNLAANGNYTAVANLDAAGKPTANLFTNDVSRIEAGKGKLTVRHTAAAPAVDVLAGGAAVVSNLANPSEQTLTLDPGTISAAVAATGTTAPVIGPADVTVAEGTHTIVYAWGSLADKNLQLAVQTIEGLHSAPGSVPGARDGSADAARRHWHRRQCFGRTGGGDRRIRCPGPGPAPWRHRHDAHHRRTSGRANRWRPAVGQ